MINTAEIVARMRIVAPAGQQELDITTTETLNELTTQLMDADASAPDEYRRFLALRERELDLSGVTPDLRTAYAGKTVLVTGGTGCIGTVLINRLARSGPGAVFSISRGRHVGAPPVPGVHYLQADVGDADAVRAVFDRVRPDVVFHLAAQRSPWLAERAMAETVLTNVVGTRNVLRSAREFDTPSVVHASTGKAMRYYTTDIYAATKKIAEWLVLQYAAEGHLAGASRFTHVVDNGVILQKIQEAMDTVHGVVRIHDPDTEFNVQSAIESAQLLLIAGLNQDRRSLRMVAIRSLGETARLLSMTLGMIGRQSRHPSIYFSGVDAGYERGNTPGLYDPRTAADIAPLINAVEAPSARELAGVAAVDEFQLSLPRVGQLEAIVDGLTARCAAGEPAALWTELAHAGRVVAQAQFDLCPDDLFYRLDRIARRGGVPLPCVRPRGVARAA